MRRVLAWRATTVPTRLGQAALIGVLAAVAVGPIAAIWFALTALTILFDAWICSRSLKRGADSFTLGICLTLGLSACVYASVSLVLLANPRAFGIAETEIALGAVMLNAALMARGASPVSWILIAPPSVPLIFGPLIAPLFGVPVPVRDAVPMMLGAASYVIFVASIARAFGQERRALLTTLEEKEADRRAFQILFEDNPLPMLVLDPATLRILNANRATTDAFGWDRDRMAARNAGALFPSETIAALRAGGDAPALTPTPVRISRSDGAERDALLYLRTSNDGVKPTLLAALLDVTDRNEAMEAIERARAAEAANSAKSEFLATFSHEIRTPLNGVLGMAQAMARGVLENDQRARLEILTQSGAALLGMLNDILDLSKIEAGGIVLEDSEFDLAELSAAVLAGFAAQAEDKGLSLSVHIDEGARGRYRGDFVRVRQIVFNLVSNAVKFTEAGRVAVRIGVQDPGLFIRVVDTGIGVPQDRTPRLFEKFVQGDPSTTRRFGGTGLGLSICRELARTMGGDIAVESVEGEGSAFTVTLRLERVDGPPGPAADAAADAPPALSGAERPLRVLAAEDNPNNRVVLSAILEASGVSLAFVEDGAAAVEAWERDPWDLILMDVRMPVMDGPTAAREIRAREARSGRAPTPIIALTANAMTHQLAQYRDAGMDRVVTKPIRVDELLLAIHGAIADVEGISPEP